MVVPLLSQNMGTLLAYLPLLTQPVLEADYWQEGCYYINFVSQYPHHTENCQWFETIRLLVDAVGAG